MNQYVIKPDQSLLTLLACGLREQHSRGKLLLRRSGNVDSVSDVPNLKRELNPKAHL